MILLPEPLLPLGRPLLPQPLLLPLGRLLLPRPPLPLGRLPLPQPLLLPQPLIVPPRPRMLLRLLRLRFLRLRPAHHLRLPEPLLLLLRLYPPPLPHSLPEVGPAVLLLAAAVMLAKQIADCHQSESSRRYLTRQVRWDYCR